MIKNLIHQQGVLLALLLLAACGSPTPPPPDEETPVVTNTAPTANAASASLTQNNAYNGQLTATDAEGDSLTFLLVTPASHGTVVIANDGAYQYIPATGFVGDDSFAYQVSDGKDMSAVMVVTIQVAAKPSEEETEPIPTPVVTNRPPLASTLAINLLEDGVYNGQVIAVDADGDPLAYQITTPATHGNVVLNPTSGEFSYTPAANYHGEDSFSFQARDGNLTSAVTVIHITIDPVNDTPQVATQAIVLDQDTIFDGALVGSDLDGDPLGFELFSQPAHGTLNLNQATGTFNYTPESLYSGDDSFSFFVHDGQTPSQIASVNITINNINDAPAAQSLAINLVEDDSYQGQLHASDVDGNLITYTLTILANHGDVVLNPTTGEFSYTPAANYHGEDSFSFQVSDGSLASTPTIVSIAVDPVNDAPQALSQEIVLDQDTVFNGVLVGSDLDGDDLSFESFSQPAHGALDLNQTTGAFSYTPAAFYHGNDSFSFFVHDGQTPSQIASVTIEVMQGNQAPSASDMAFATTEDTPYDGQLLGSDPDDNALTYSITVDPLYGTINLDAQTGSFSYMPSLNYHGIDSFSYKVNNSTTDSNEAIVTITVTSVNDAPIVFDLNDLEVVEWTAITEQVSGIDPDSDLLSYMVVGEPVGGIVDLDEQTGIFNFYPHPGFIGLASFEFEANDGQNVSTPAQVSIQVIPDPNIILPPNPQDIAPAVDLHLVGTFFSRYGFLVDIQPGLDPNAIVDERFSIIKGRVLRPDGTPLSGIKISIKNKPEYGYTYSREDGYYDFAINGGSDEVIEFSRAGFLPAQRKVYIFWNEFVQMADVVIVRLDPQVTKIDLANLDGVAIARGSEINDERGLRQAAVTFKPSTQAYMEFADENSQPITKLNVRLTEYTVGDYGLEAMPAELAMNTAYTYAVELSVDQALLSGAKSVHFSKPVHIYLTNFLDLPTGTLVPNGSYNSEGYWQAEPNGAVIEIVDIQNGEATIDIDGNGPETVTTLTGLGFDMQERQLLAQQYPIGTKLWWAKAEHFSPYDLNHARSGCDPSSGLCTPDPDFKDTGPEHDCNTPNCDCQISPASTISCLQQAFSEQVNLVGIPYTLHYWNNLQRGHTDKISFDIGTDTPSLMKYIGIDVDIAGKRFSFTEPTNRHNFNFIWDGYDVYGRRKQGAETAKISITHYFPFTLGFTAAGITGQEISCSACAYPIRSFGATAASSFTLSDDYNEAGITQTYDYQLIQWDAKHLNSGLGGWTLSNHHHYDKGQQVVLKGDGSIIDKTEISEMVKIKYQITNGKFIGGVVIGASDEIYFTYQAGGNKLYQLVNGAPLLVGTLNPQANNNSLVATNLVRLDNEIYYSFYNISTKTPQGIVYAFNLTTQAIRLIANFGSSKIIKIDYDYDGNIYALIDSSNGDRIYKIDANGSWKIYFGAGNQAYVDGISIHQWSSGSSVVNFSVDRTTNSIYIYIYKSFDGIYEVQDGGQTYLIAGGGNSTAEGAYALSTKIEAGVHSSLQVMPNGDIVYSNIWGNLRRITKDKKVYTILGDSVNTWGTITNNSIALQTRTDSWGMRNIAVDHRGTTLWGAIGGDSSYYSAIYQVGYSQVMNNVLQISDFHAKELYEFAEDGRHLRTRDIETNIVKYQFYYNADKLLIGIEDRDGNLTQIIRDNNNNPVKIVSPFGQETNLVINSNGYLESIIRPDNHGHTFSYTEDGLMTSMTNPNDDSTLVTYNERGDLISDIDQVGAEITLDKIVAENSKTVTVTSGMERITTHDLTVDLENNQVQRTVTLPDATQSIHTSIPPTGTVIKQHPNGTIYTTLLQKADLRFNVIGRNKILTVETPSHLKSTTTIDYSHQGLVSMFNFGSETVTTKVNNRIYTNTYSPAVSTWTIISPVGRQIVEVLDAEGNIVTRTIGNLTPKQYTYDQFGRLTQITQDDGNQLRQTSFTYDNLGRIDTLTDPENQTSNFQYDDINRLTLQTLPSTEEIAMSYDGNSNMTSIVPPGQPSHGFMFTPVNLLSQYTPPNIGLQQHETIFNYDLDRNIEDVTLPNGDLIDYVYDVDTGQLLTINTPGADYSFGYNQSTGQLNQITLGSETLALVYDGFLPKSQTWSGTINGSVVSTYNNNFWETALNVAGTSFSFGYDNDGLITSVDNNVYTLSHDPINGLMSSTSLDIIDETYTYNNFGELESHSATTGQTLYDVSYVRDKLGRIIQKTEIIEGIQTVYDYTYDNNNHLDTVSIDNNPVRDYSYDQNGNRMGPLAASYDAQDRLLTYDGTSYTYSDNGNLLTKNNGQETSFTYDTFGNLRNVTLPNNTQIEYIIDGKNRRIGKKVDGQLAQGFLYKDQLNPVAELDGNGNVVSRFVYAERVHIPSYMIKNNIKYKIISDHLGSVRLIVNATNGTVAQRIDYDEFGNTVSDTNPGFQPFGFAGGLADSDTGLIRFGARDYDPQIGRWTAKDPIHFHGGQTNLYVYVNNDPINFIDSNGLFFDEVIGAFSDFIKNYIDLREANTIGADKYFHCKANCEAARRGPAAEFTSEVISICRETSQLLYTRDTLADSFPDLLANDYGRYMSMNSDQSCSGVCEVFRPNGLSSEY